RPAANERRETLAIPLANESRALGLPVERSGHARAGLPGDVGRREAQPEIEQPKEKIDQAFERGGVRAACAGAGAAARRGGRRLRFGGLAPPTPELVLLPPRFVRR